MEGNNLLTPEPYCPPPTQSLQGPGVCRRRGPEGVGRSLRASGGASDGGVVGGGAGEGVGGGVGGVGGKTLVIGGTGKVTFESGPLRAVHLSRQKQPGR